MKLLPLIIFLLTLSNFSYAQLSGSKRTTIHKLAGAKFTELPNQAFYSYSTSGPFTADLSITQPGDTSGIFAGQEYLLFRDPIAFRADREVLKLIGNDYVTNADYLVFQEYVRDSMAREKIQAGFYRTGNHDKEIAGYLQYPVNNQYANGEPIDLSNRYKNRELFPFNWKHPFSYNDPELLPLLADMYLPQPERFYKVRAFDERKLMYKFYEDYSLLASSAKDSALLRTFLKVSEQDEINLFENHVATFSDYYSWASKSTAYRDEFAVIAQSYTQLKEFRDKPVVGLTGSQAKAYCHWKQEKLQRECDAKKLHVIVQITLPTSSDHEAFALPKQQLTVPEHDYTAQWKITAGEYALFVAAVQDSILKEKLYGIIDEKDALELLAYTPIYFDEGWLQNRKISYDLGDIRYYFSFRPGFSTKNPDVLKEADAIRKSESYANPVYRYYDVEAFKRSITGTFTKTYAASVGAPKLAHFYTQPQQDENGDPIGKDLDIGYYTMPGHNSGVRSHENLARFYDKTEVAVLPSNASVQQKNELVKGITYKQALAFYHWKYRIYQLILTDSWQQFVLPTEEQFTQVQNGETLIVPEHQLDFPTTLFRYVLHVYPKGE